MILNEVYTWERTSNLHHQDSTAYITAQNPKKLKNSIQNQNGNIASQHADSNQLNLVELDEYAITAAKSRQIITTNDKIYIPLIKSPNATNDQHYIRQATYTNNTNNCMQKQNSSVVSSINGQGQICLTTTDMLCDQEYNHAVECLGVICINRNSNYNKSIPRNNLSYDETNAIKQIVLLASVGLKHVRMLRKLEISNTTSSIRKSVLDFLASPNLSELTVIYNKMVSLYSEDTLEAMNLANLTTINFPAMSKTEDDLLFYAIRMIKFIIEYTPDDNHPSATKIYNHEMLRNPLLKSEKNKKQTKYRCMTDTQLKSLCSFMFKTKRLYRPVTYHNWRHVFNVGHAIFYFITQTRIKDLLSKNEKLAMIISGFCHDLDHRGVNNKYEELSESDIGGRFLFLEKIGNFLFSHLK